MILSPEGMRVAESLASQVRHGDNSGMKPDTAANHVGGHKSPGGM
jgi:hypothetical protein